MRKSIQAGFALAAMILVSGSMSFAQSAGEATYKAKCQSCHGAEGVPNPGIAKAMGVKPATDPAVKEDAGGGDDFRHQERYCEDEASHRPHRRARSRMRSIISAPSPSKFGIVSARFVEQL